MINLNTVKEAEWQSHRVSKLHEKLDRLDKLTSCPIEQDTTRPLFIEVGGDSTHFKIYPETEQEKEEIKEVLRRVLLSRLEKSRNRLKELGLK
jgi:hypothetical protein